MQLKSITAIAVLLLVVTSLSVTGCTSLTGSADLTDVFNKWYSNSKNTTIVTPFHKNTSAHGNDLYVGVTNLRGNTTKISIEFAKSEEDAAQVFNDTVAAFTSNGRVTESLKPASSTDGRNPGLTWVGAKGVEKMSVSYFYNGDFMDTGRKVWEVITFEPV
jgi:hypothetical protein